MHAIVPVEKSFKRTPLPLAPGNCFVRTITAKAIGSLHEVPPRAVAATMWPSDRITTELLERAATAPAMTTVAGWAAELVHAVVSDMLHVLGGVSAGIELLRRGLVVTFDQAGLVYVPALVIDATSASFVAQGQPIPVRQLTVGPSQLPFTKLASIAVLTREMVDSSNAEALIGEALSRAAGLALDAALFDANPATAARPAGLRNGITAITGSTNTDASEAFLADISALIGAVSAVGGNGPFVLVMSPARAAMSQIRLIMEAGNIVVLGSTAVGTAVVAVAPQALAAAVGAAPEIETSKASTLHMDTAPQPVGTAGPHKSMFQTESVAVKMHLAASWILRDPRGVAWLTPSWQ